MEFLIIRTTVEGRFSLLNKHIDISVNMPHNKIARHANLLLGECITPRWKFGKKFNLFLVY